MQQHLFELQLPRRAGVVLTLLASFQVRVAAQNGEQGAPNAHPEQDNTPATQPGVGAVKLSNSWDAAL